MKIDGDKTRIATDTEAFRNAVRFIRKSQGLTQGELAARARVSRRWLSRFETGEDPDRVELYKALAVARALGTNVVITSAEP